MPVMDYKFYTIIRKGRKYKVTTIRCVICKKERIVYKDNIVKKKWTNKCKICNSKNNLPRNQRGKGNVNWKGGRYKTKNGYILVWLDEKDVFYSMAYNGYILEHRYLIAKKLGRCLETFEQVHHLNGIKDDNRLENLQLLDGSVHCLITKLQTRIKELEGVKS